MLFQTFKIYTKLWVKNGIPILCSKRFSVVKIQNFQKKKIDIFLIFCSIHRLWIHIRTVSARRYITRTCYPDDKHRKRKRNLTWHYSTFSLRKPVHAIYSIVSAVLIKFLDFLLLFFLCIIFQNIDCGYTLEPPRRGGSNEYPQSMF